VTEADENAAYVNGGRQDLPGPPETALRPGLLERCAARAKKVARAALLSRVVVEARRIRSLSVSARGKYLRGMLVRSRQRQALPTLALHSPAIFLFVCHGNIMRSAIAAELFRSRLSGSSKGTVIVRSAGTNALAGSVADPRMCEAAALLGVSLASHRATPITASLVREAHAVFVMDYLNEAELLTYAPFARSKLFLLGAFSAAPDGDLEIADPFMFDDAAVRECALRIRGSIDALVESLERGE
jgi:protein-tyrosine phosphatase